MTRVVVLPDAAGRFPQRCTGHLSASVCCLACRQTVARCLAMSSLGVARSQEGQGRMAGRDIRPDWA